MLAGGSGEGEKTGDDPASSAARISERSIVLVAAGAGMACVGSDRGGPRSGLGTVDVDVDVDALEGP